MRNAYGVLVMTVLAFFLALVGCGGGGGGGEAVTWNGSTEPAVMDTTDPTTWALAQYETETPGPEEVIFLGKAATGDPLEVVKGLPADPRELAAYLEGVAIRYQQPIAAPQSYEVALTSVLVGNISGTVTATIEVDVVSGKVRMTIEADNYADNSTTESNGYLEEMDGTYIMTMSGMENGAQANVAVIFRDFYQHFESDGTKTLFDGSFSADYNSAATTVTTRVRMDLAVTDSVTLTSAWFHDYDVTQVDDAVGQSRSVFGSGRVYKDDEGYVDFAITPAIAQARADSHPNSGAITFSNPGGWVRLEFLDSTSFRVTTSWGFDSGTVSWVT